MSTVDLIYLIGVIAAFTVFGVTVAVVSNAEREHNRRQTQGTQNSGSRQPVMSAHGAH